MPSEPFTGVVLANELLDNLAFRLLELTADGWREVYVENGVEVLEPTDHTPAVEARIGARVPIQAQAAAWVRDALAVVRRGRVVAIDYTDTTAAMAARPWSDWVRTYRSHGRGSGPLDDPGSQDITCEVAVDQLPPPTSVRTQAEFLRAHGIEQLTDSARAAWEERAAIGDLEALKSRSRLSEAAALTDPAGLGGFSVLEWVVDLDSPHGAGH
jgi:SAM-dependent MidA family methyltransferase